MPRFEATININGQPCRVDIIQPPVVFTGWQQGSRQYEIKHAPVTQPIDADIPLEEVA